MKMEMSAIVSRKVTELHGYEKNAKRHPEEQIKHIAESLKEFGWKQPLVVDSNGCIVIGHGRFEAAKLLGLTEVPCIIADDLTPEQIRALRLADNKTNESPWDFGNLDEELGDLAGLFDMSMFGFSGSEDSFDADSFFEDNESNEQEEEAPTQIKCPHCGKYFTPE